jgi:release factor glutamine methyltransferase
MKTLGEILTISAGFLKEKKCPRFRRGAEELIAHVLKLKRLDLYMLFDRPVQEAELETLRAFLKRAAKGEPVEYIIGEVLFYHCQLSIGPGVLIPRPETEILVDLACRMLRTVDLHQKIAWDVCTGSGCIGIAVKKACPDLCISLSDISEKALEIVAMNACKNDVQMEFLKGDLLAPFDGRKADFIFCNPPYISSEEFLTLDPSVKDYEPSEALIGGDDGLSFYRRLENELPSYLNPQAKIFLEIGRDQGASVLNIFSRKGWKNRRVEKDWAGHDRFFFLEFE